MIVSVLQHISRVLDRVSTARPKRRALSRLNYVQLMERRDLLSAVHVIPAPANVEFVDMGYDPVSGEVGIVGYVVDGVDKTATVFELNTAGDGFDSATLADLPGATGKAFVNGISSDASRIAGVSKSPGTVGAGEGATWLRNSPAAPVGIGTDTDNGFANTSTAIGAWRDGVVGECGGGDAACIWTTSGSLITLEGHEGGIA